MRAVHGGTCGKSIPGISALGRGAECRPIGKPINRRTRPIVKPMAIVASHQPEGSGTSRAIKYTEIQRYSWFILLL
jgi:hypothetical protein